MTFTDSLIHHAEELGYGIQVFGIGELTPDYEGSNANDALELILDQEEVYVYFWQEGQARDFAHLIPENDGAEALVDCYNKGFVNDFSNSWEEAQL